VVSADDGLMSVVTGGLVLVIVSVVVAVPDGLLAVAENVGWTKSIGASWWPFDVRVTSSTAETRAAMTTSPATLAPTTAGVLWCHGCASGGWSSHGASASSQW
jgi:hypothetical protein